MIPSSLDSADFNSWWKTFSAELDRVSPDRPVEISIEGTRAQFVFVTASIVQEEWHRVGDREIGTRIFAVVIDGRCRIIGSERANDLEHARLLRGRLANRFGIPEQRSVLVQRIDIGRHSMDTAGEGPRP